jgi:hypothetical protein
MQLICTKPNGAEYKIKKRVAHSCVRKDKTTSWFWREGYLKTLAFALLFHAVSPKKILTRPKLICPE